MQAHCLMYLIPSAHAHGHGARTQRLKRRLKFDDDDEGEGVGVCQFIIAYDLHHMITYLFPRVSTIYSMYHLGPSRSQPTTPLLASGPRTPLIL